MNQKELAKKMLEWSDLQSDADKLKSEIEEAVLSIGKTQTVGNVRCTFRNGRKSYNYEAAAKDHPSVNDNTISLFTKQSAPKIDWRGICNHVGIDDVPFEVSEPSVSINLINSQGEY